jgi:NADPH-dependent curcumin reductase CurA
MSSSPTQTQQWHLAHKPTSLPILSGPNQTFQLTTTGLPLPLKDNQLLLKLHYLSNDPAQRGWINPTINPDRLYLPPVALNTPMHARGLAEVLDSTSQQEGFQKGDFVLASMGWSAYAVMDAKACQAAPALPKGLSRTHYLGALGMTGLTAYYGIKEVGETKPGDVVVVSGAAGATGSMVVQIAKKVFSVKRVVGIAGGAEKCRYVEEVLGADRCVDYKKEGWREELVEATSAAKGGNEKGFVDVYFDNVGGGMLDFMLTRMALHGRVVACGAISEYNSSEGTLLKNYFEVISMRIQIRGMIVFDYVHKMQEVMGIFQQAIQEGKLKIGEESEHVVEAGFEDVPKVWMKLFEGANTGKLITKVM